MAEYFSPTVFSPAVLGWDLANARFGLGTSRMPMRGKLRCSFRCTLIFFARLVKLSFFMAARIYFRFFEQNVVFVHAKCVTKLAQVRRCLWPDRNITMPGHHFAWPDWNTKFAGPPCLWPDPKHQIRRTSLPMAGPKHQIRRTSLPMAGPWDKLTCAPPDLPAYGRTGHPLWNLQSYWMAGRGAAAENMDTEKNLEAALFSLFLSH